MLSKKLLKAVVALSFFMTGALGAAESTREIQVALKGLGITADNISLSPVRGLYEIQVGTQIVYLSEDGKYMLTGNLISMLTRENLTEKRLDGIRAKAIDAIGDNQMISFKAKKPEHTVAVFTDIDCGYCRKLHSQMDEYNRQGISINYLFYPRAGIGSSSYQSAVSVWCNKDRNAALTRAKAGQKLPSEKCDNPVARHYELGGDMGIRGTPAIITEYGNLLPGYVPPASLKKQLDLLKSEQLAGKKISRK